MSLHKASCVLLLCLLVFVIVECAAEAAVNRRDVHRIVLKSDRPRKIHKKPRSHYKNHHNHDYEAHGTKHYSDEVSRETSREYSLEVSVPHRYKNLYVANFKNYDNHHAKYHDLMKPKPPPPKQEEFIINYPEEIYQDHNHAASNHYETPYRDLPGAPQWTPLTPQNNQVYENPHYPNYDFGPTSNGNTQTTIDLTNTQPKQNKRKKKSRRKVTEKPKTFIELIDLTTAQPQKLPPIIDNLYNNYKNEASGASSNHYVNYNHKNKSIIQYEINNHKNVIKPYKTPQNSYEVYEDIDDSKPPKHTSYQNLSPVNNYAGQVGHPYQGAHLITPTYSSITEYKIPRNRTKTKTISSSYGSKQRNKSKRNRLGTTKQPPY